MPLLLTAVLGGFLLVGIGIVKLSHREFIEHLSIAVAFGAMLALACFDLIPEILESYIGTGRLLALFFTVIGFVVLVVLDRFIPEHEDGSNNNSAENLNHIGFLAAIAITIHNIVEGMTVYSMTMQSVNTGISMAIGVGLHNIPMGMLIYSTLQGHHNLKKYSVMFITVASTFFGGLLMFFLSGMVTEAFMSALICMALGMVLYILVFELLPSVWEMKKERSVRLGCTLGVLLVFLSCVIGG